MTTTPKNPAAVALGRLGGSKNTPAQDKARALNARKGGWPKGRPRKVTHYHTGRGTLCSLDNDASIRTSTPKEQIHTVTCSYCLNLLAMDPSLTLEVFDKCIGHLVKAGVVKRHTKPHA